MHKGKQIYFSQFWRSVNARPGATRFSCLTTSALCFQDAHHRCILEHDTFCGRRKKGKSDKFSVSLFMKAVIPSVREK